MRIQKRDCEGRDGFCCTKNGGGREILLSTATYFGGKTIYYCPKISADIFWCASHFNIENPPTRKKQNKIPPFDKIGFRNK